MATTAGRPEQRLAGRDVPVGDVHLPEPAARLRAPAALTRGAVGLRGGGARRARYARRLVEPAERDARVRVARLASAGERRKRAGGIARRARRRVRAAARRIPQRAASKVVLSRASLVGRPAAPGGDHAPERATRATVRGRAAPFETRPRRGRIGAATDPGFVHHRHRGARAGQSPGARRRDRAARARVPARPTEVVHEVVGEQRAHARALRLAAASHRPIERPRDDSELGMRFDRSEQRLARRLVAAIASAEMERERARSVRRGRRHERVARGTAAGHVPAHAGLCGRVGRGRRENRETRDRGERERSSRRPEDTERGGQSWRHHAQIILHGEALTASKPTPRSRFEATDTHFDRQVIVQRPDLRPRANRVDGIRSSRDAPVLRRSVRPGH